MDIEKRKELLVEPSPVFYVFYEIHGEDGYYWHYHPTRNHQGYKSIHIWYYD